MTVVRMANIISSNVVGIAKIIGTTVVPIDTSMSNELYTLKFKTYEMSVRITFKQVSHICISLCSSNHLGAENLVRHSITHCSFE